MRILVVDDEPGLRHTLTRILGGEGHEVASAPNGAAALEALDARDADLVLCDVRMPEMDGLTFLERYQARGGRALVLMMSAYGDDEVVIDAMQRGAYDFVTKPFRADQVILVVRKAMERERLRRRVEELSGELESLRGADGIVGGSEAMRRILELARKVARHPSTVLVTGESGTGKEVVARYVHRESPRADAPFVAVNCAAIPESLLESELFGHTRGAFTGATAERRGLFEEADGGTLFLDEIGELPVALQVKLLRALQEGEIRRVGESVSRAVDVRLLAATSRDLEGDVASGRFRSDLYYRINVVRLHLPPLRERREDIGPLARHFVVMHARRFGGAAPPPALTAAALRRLEEHGWPGNVRELENAIERALVLCEGDRIDVEHLERGEHPPAPAATNGSHPGGASADLSVKRRTEALERALIAEALQRTGGNRTRAAQILELSHRALLYKIREYGLGE
jgi:two-component system response regulator AtoC